VVIIWCKNGIFATNKSYAKFMKEIKGTGVALVTPFNQDGSVDYSGLERVVRNVIDSGVDFLVVFGTTAETPTLNDDEKQKILSFVKNLNAERLPIMVGMSGNNTALLIEQIRNFDFTGIDALLSASPYYNKPSQEGIYRHFMAVAEASPVPVMLYNVPGRTGSNMLPETVVRLARDNKNIMGIKEASGNMAQVSKILRDKPDGFELYSGEDNLAVATIALGGKGIISVAANAFPKPFSKMINYALEGDAVSASALQLELFEIIELLFAEGNPVGVKTALSIEDICNQWVRLPLVPGTDCLREKMQKIIAQKFA
jgi:4-hydroxy-tetrahydrodipicolinate synthase